MRGILRPKFSPAARSMVPSPPRTIMASVSLGGLPPAVTLSAPAALSAAVILAVYTPFGSFILFATM